MAELKQDSRVNGDRAEVSLKESGSLIFERLITYVYELRYDL